MTILSDFAEIDRKFAWSTLGFVLAVFFGALTIYDRFVKNSDAELSVQILSDTRVLDVRENVPELKIFYGDVDIKSVNQVLSVVVFRVQNSGGAAILNSYYDEKASPQLILNGGKFVRVEKSGATNEYLKGVELQPFADSALLLPRVIIEPGESYTLKALMLQPTQTALPFHAIGKVAGTKQIEVFPAPSDGKVEGFWEQAFRGSPGVQLARGVDTSSDSFFF